MEIDKTVKNILDIRDTLMSKDFDKWQGDELTRAITKLAGYKHFLGEHIAGLKFEATNYYNQRKVDEAQMVAELIKRGMKVTEAKNKAEIDIHELRKLEAEKERDYGYLRTVHSDTGDLITAIQSRLKYLISERIGTYGEENPTTEGS